MNARIDSADENRNASRIALNIAGLAVSVIVAACGGSGKGGGGCGAYSSCPPPSSGANEPSITLSAPGTTVNRGVTLAATPSASNGVMRVDFLVDGSVIGMATASPYTVTWDTGTTSDGAHSVTARVTDNQNQSATSAATSVTVANNLTLTLALTPNEEYPVPASSASGAGQLAVNLSTGIVSGNFTVSGMTANAAHIHDAYAGNNGGIQIAFAPHGTIANRWDLPANSLLSTAQVDRLIAGALYVNAHSVAYPGGEIRAQIKPDNIRVVLAAMTGTQEVPAVTTTASGVVAVTVDNAANKLAAHVKTTGVASATSVGLYKAATGANAALATFALTKDLALSGHWFLEGQSLTASDLADFNGGLWYANALTPVNPTGEIRGQLAVASVATTLTQLQSSIFTPICSGCHSGGGASLPSSMNLTSAASSYAALVGVASVEQSSVLRVAPNDAAGSYIVRKLEGTAGITGSRMPLGGPFLSQTTIDTVKSWINAGALNN